MYLISIGLKVRYHLEHVGVPCVNIPKIQMRIFNALWKFQLQFGFQSHMINLTRVFPFLLYKYNASHGMVCKRLRRRWSTSILLDSNNDKHTEKYWIVKDTNQLSFTVIDLTIFWIVQFIILSFFSIGPRTLIFKSFIRSN